MVPPAVIPKGVRFPLHLPVLRDTKDFYAPMLMDKRNAFIIMPDFQEELNQHTSTRPAPQEESVTRGSSWTDHRYRVRLDDVVKTPDWRVHKDVGYDNRCIVL